MREREQETVMKEHGLRRGYVERKERVMERSKRDKGKGLRKSEEGDKAREEMGGV